MTTSEEAARHITRARRFRKLIVPVLVLMWLLGTGLWSFKLSVLLKMGREHGIDSYSQLLSSAFGFDGGRLQFNSWDVFLMGQGNSLRTTVDVLVVVTIFMLANIPPLRLIETLAKEVETTAQRRRSHEISRIE